jgi:3-hydroxy-5-methyl-1-naphthoate 3-O-methyltransferase
MATKKQTAIWEELMQKAAGYREAKVILLGADLGIFEALCQRSLKASQLAKKLGLAERATQIICDALVGMKYLSKKDDVYHLNPSLVPFMDPESQDSRISSLRHTAGSEMNWARLGDIARGKIKDPSKHRQVLSDKRKNQDFILAMHQNNPARAEEMAEAIDLDGCASLCDVGPGPGHYSIALARKYPKLQVALVDHANSLEVARAFVGQQPARISKRFTFVEGDLIKESCPDWGGPFDSILLSNVIHIFDSKNNKAAIKKLGRQLSPGGFVIVRDFGIEDNMTEPPLASLFAVNMLAATKAGRCYSANEVKAWMTTAGLVKIKKTVFYPSYLVQGHAPMKKGKHQPNQIIDNLD